MPSLVYGLLLQDVARIVPLARPASAAGVCYRVDALADNPTRRYHRRTLHALRLTLRYA